MSNAAGQVLGFVVGGGLVILFGPYGVWPALRRWRDRSVYGGGWAPRREVPKWTPFKKRGRR